MKFLIYSLGTRGDVQPYLALAVHLQKIGHQVTLAAPVGFADWIRSYEVGVHPVRFVVQAYLQQPEAQAARRSGNPLRQFRMMREISAGAQSANDDFWEAAQEADFVLQTGTGNGALEIAALRGIPVAFAYLVPFAPTRAFPPFLLPFRFSLGPAYNRLAQSLLQRALWHGMAGPMANRWRKRLGLPPWRSPTEMERYARNLGAPSLYGFSPSVIPRPPDWDERFHVTGYWFLDDPPGWAPPPDLLRFLETGPPPIYVGFGSMAYQDPERQASLVLRALELAGRRAVLSMDRFPGRNDSKSPDLFFVDGVPHSRLFPRMAAVIHHGGAGTTAACLRAGVPAVVVPFAGDQFAWADVVAKLGAGPRVGGIKGLTPEKLAEGIHAALHDRALRATAAMLGARIRAEDGLGQAQAILEGHAERVLSRTGVSIQ
jgi:UDP:flavonoid glycosyltransferase YjiC (YdhE family)